MALPTFELHNTLHGFAVDHNAAAAQRRPDHAVAQVRFLVDDALDALGQNVIYPGRPCPAVVVRAAARQAQEPADRDSGEAFASNKSIERCSLSSKGMIRKASLAISPSITS